jgi:RNA polymerase sigma-70 factor (ECF subfamily)
MSSTRDTPPSAAGEDRPPTALQQSQLQQARREFTALVETLRPDLHRYCARMVGSVIDGEDVVQDTLARGYYELSALKEPPALRAWLFRIAHNRALDQLRRYERRMSEPLDSYSDELVDENADPSAQPSRQQAVTLAITRFVQLAPTQRSCVILKDVLEFSLQEIAGQLDLTVESVKAALHRGRNRLRELSAAVEADPVGMPTRVSPTIQRYAELFNARDWDGIRAMLIDEVSLDVVDATQRRGRKDVGVYYTNYSRRENWYVAPATLEGRQGLAVFASGSDRHIRNFIELTVSGGQIARIRDFHHVSYFTHEAAIECAER